MAEILTRAGCFVVIILLGYILRRTGVFGPETFGVLSKIVMKITVPAALIASAAGKPIDLSMLNLVLLGFCGGVVYSVAGWILGRKDSRGMRAFYVENLPGYNIGTFGLPFTQSFLGPVGVLTTSLFDLGNAIFCFGGAYCVAQAVKDGGKPDLGRIGKTALTSLPFLTHLVMMLLNLNHLTPPGPVLSLAQILGSGNAFLAMLMIGVSIEISLDGSKLGIMTKVLGVRFGLAVLLALACYRWLPFSLEIRQTLVILCFTPLTSTTAYFTSELGEDVGLASTINSLSIVISIIILVALLPMML